MQTKLNSLRESLVNILIGYIVAISSQLLIFPLFGVNIPLTDNLLIGVFFTVVSLARSYTIRRWFNHSTKEEQDSLGVDCPGCHKALTVHNTGGYRCYCETCVNIMPPLPMSVNNNGFYIDGNYPNFIWIEDND